MEGKLSRVSAENRHLLTFVSTLPSRCVCSNALVFIPGLTDGFMSLEHVAVPLNPALLQLDYSLVQVNLSSSFDQFGFQSLEQDIQELTLIINFIKDEYKFNKIILLGHSTGCQDIVYLLKHCSSDTSQLINGIILHGAISDRDDIIATESGPSMIAEAQHLQNEGKENAFLTEKHCDAPIIAKRFLSLSGRLTPDDMFSVDLSEAELTPIYSGIKVPVLLAFSGEDEYVPDKDQQRSFADLMVKVIGFTSPVVRLVYVPRADHGLTTNESAMVFVENVINFITKSIL